MGFTRVSTTRSTSGNGSLASDMLSQVRGQNGRFTTTFKRDSKRIRTHVRCRTYC